MDFGSGRGRNCEALRQAGLAVTALDDAEASDAKAISILDREFEAVLSTHALLHGMPQSITDRISAIARAVKPDGLFFATFASVRDARYGNGTRVGDHTFAPTAGDEVGVPHVYYDERRLRALVGVLFEVESLEERSVDAVAGRWAHPNAPLHGAVHWFARARHPQRS